MLKHLQDLRYNCCDSGEGSLEGGKDAHLGETRLGFPMVFTWRNGPLFDVHVPPLLLLRACGRMAPHAHQMAVLRGCDTQAAGIVFSSCIKSYVDTVLRDCSSYGGGGGGQ